MDKLLAIATLLGGVSALWFFGDKALSWMKHRPEELRSNWAYGTKTAKAVMYYLALLSSAALAGFTSLLRTARSPLPGAVFLIVFSASFFWLYTDGIRSRSTWTLLKGTGGFLVGACLSFLLLLIINPGSLTIPGVGTFSAPDADPKLAFTPLLGSVAGIGGGVAGLKELLEGRTLASALAVLSLVFGYNLFMGTAVLVYFEGLIGLVVAFLVSGTITGGIVYLAFDDIASATHNSEPTADGNRILRGSRR